MYKQLRSDLICYMIIGFVWKRPRVDPLTGKLFISHFQPLEVVQRWRDSQLQAGEYYAQLTKWRSTILEYDWCHVLSSWYVQNLVFNV